MMGWHCSRRRLRVRPILRRICRTLRIRWVEIGLGSGITPQWKSPSSFSSGIQPYPVKSTATTFNLEETILLLLSKASKRRSPN